MPLYLIKQLTVLSFLLGIVVCLPFQNVVNIWPNMFRNQDVCQKMLMDLPRKCCNLVIKNWLSFILHI